MPEGLVFATCVLEDQDVKKFFELVLVFLEFTLYSDLI